MNKSQKEIINMVQSHKAQVEKKLLKDLIFMGETFILVSKKTSYYADRNYFIKHSVGYILLNNGNFLVKDFKEETDTDSSVDEVVKIVAPKHSNGYVLIMVSGKNYLVFDLEKGPELIEGTIF